MKSLIDHPTRARREAEPARSLSDSLLYRGPALLAALLLAPVSAFGQESLGDDALAEEVEILEGLDLDKLFSLDVVKVTAQKRIEDLQDVPSSVASLQGQRVDLLRVSGADVRFLSLRIPSLYVESSFGRTFPRFYIRGLGNPDFDLNASQPVSILLDGIVLENPIIKSFPLFDLDRVEVLRGPQGTLFGRNTPAGAVKLESRRPTFDTSGQARLTYGSFNFFGFEGVGNVSLVDDVLAARVSVLFERRDDWIENALDAAPEPGLEGFDDLAGRLQFRLVPSPSTEVLLSAHFRCLDGTARVFHANMIEPGTDRTVAGFRRDRVTHDGRNEQRVMQYGFVAEIQQDLGPLRLTSLTGLEKADLFSRGDIDGGFGAVFAPPSGPGLIPFPSESADAVPDLTQFSQELRLGSREWDLVNFQAGVFLFLEDLRIESRSFDSLAGGVQNGFASQSQQATGWAAFGTAWVDPFEGLRLTGGLRYSNDQKRFRAERTESPIGGSPIELSERTQADFVSWDLSARWEFAPDISAFARASTSFRAPSIQGRILFGDQLSTAQSEDILSFEAGLKALFAGGKVRTNVAGYWFQLNDQQLTAVGGDVNFNRLLNAARSAGRGLELDAEALPIRGLNLGLGVSYNFTEIQDPNLAITPCGGGCTVTNPAGPVANTVLINGNPLPHAPEWIVNLSARYELELNRRDALFAFTNWSYRSRVHFFLYQSLEFTDPQMILGDVRVGYRRDDQLQVSVFASNLLDTLTRTGGVDFNNLTGFLNDPRTFGVEVSGRL